MSNQVVNTLTVCKIMLSMELERKEKASPLLAVNAQAALLQAALRRPLAESRKAAECSQPPREPGLLQHSSEEARIAACENPTES